MIHPYTTKAGERRYRVRVGRGALKTFTRKADAEEYEAA